MRIAEAITHIQTESETVAKRQALEYHSFPFEREHIDKSFPDLRNFKPCPELDSAFKRVDLAPLLAMRKRQEGIPFPVPRFTMINIWNEEAATLKFSLFWTRDRNLGVNERDSYSIPRIFWDPLPSISAGAVKNLNHLNGLGVISITLTVLAMIGVGIITAIFGWWYASLLVIPAALIAIGVRQNTILHRYVNKDIVLSAKPGGFLPERTRQLAIEHHDKFSFTFLLFEPHWTMDMKDTPVRNVDPLLIGVRFSKEEGGYVGAWIIDDFDLTDAEQFAKEKFSYQDKK